MMALERVPGLGQKLADKLREHFDGEDAAMAALQSGDISRIAAVNGVSPKRALALARAASGDDVGFLATREAEKLHAQLIEAMRQHAACAASRERLALLTPIQYPESRWAVVDAARRVADLVDALAPRFPSERVHVFGFADGGVVALEVAASLRDRDRTVGGVAVAARARCRRRTTTPIASGAPVEQL